MKSHTIYSMPLSYFESKQYAWTHYLIGDVGGFKNGANRTFQIDQDSSGIHWTIIASFWLEKKYDEVTAYYEENQNILLDQDNIKDWLALVI